MKFRYKIAVATMMVATLFSGLAVQAVEPVSDKQLTILFTHDLHDRFLPVTTNDGGESGGFARLFTTIEEQRELAEGAVITVDGGDFAMGSLFQTIYTTQAPGLRALGMMGYDGVVLGNHEFDYRRSGLVAMLRSALESGDALPPLVMSNYKAPEEATETWDVWNEYGISEYMIIERDGVKVAMFGTMGEGADAYAPMSGMEFETMEECATRVVAEIKEKENPDYIICLSHAGTTNGQGEDYELAKAVDGIDVIVSGHSHTIMHEPIEVNGTLLVSCGEYAEYLGVLVIDEDGLVDYQLVPIDENVADHPEMLDFIQEFKQMTQEDYLSDYELEFDEVLASNPYKFTLFDEFGADHSDEALGNLIGDAYVYAVKEAEGDDYTPVDFAVIPAGVVRGTFSTGDITTSDAFDVLSLGVGADETPGYPLVSAYLTGKELKDVFEVDASVTGIMPVAQLWGAGMTWTYNPNRMLFNRVTDCGQILDDGTVVDIVDDQVYRIVTGLYSVQMLGAVNAQSFGILTVTPKDEFGEIVTDFEQQIITNQEGAEVKEWYALASYLKSMGGELDEQYAQAQNRKISAPSWNPIHLLKGANWITFTVIGVVVVPVAGITYGICRFRKRKAKK